MCSLPDRISRLRSSLPERALALSFVLAALAPIGLRAQSAEWNAVFQAPGMHVDKLFGREGFAVAYRGGEFLLTQNGTDWTSIPPGKIDPFGQPVIGQTSITSYGIVSFDGRTWRRIDSLLFSIPRDRGTYYSTPLAPVGPFWGTAIRPDAKIIALLDPVAWSYHKFANPFAPESLDSQESLPPRWAWSSRLGVIRWRDSLVSSARATPASPGTRSAAWVP